MGTRWSVLMMADAGAAEALRPSVEALFTDIVREMSTWKPDSHISRFNRAPAGSWHVLPPAFFHVLTTALEIAEASGGAFDPCVGKLVDAWGFGAAPPGSMPVPTPLANGWHSIALDLPAQRALQPGGVALDLSGIAKGYAVDRLASLIASRGVRQFLAEVGGEFVGMGLKPDGQPWWLDIEAPPGASLARIRVALHGLAAATSGDYRRSFEANGRRYSHSIDPRTGAPIDNHVASVTVLHDSCILADAYATAITVLGPEEGMHLADRLGLAAYMMVREEDGFGERLSPAFAAMLD